jgi:hypothetical protein
MPPISPSGDLNSVVNQINQNIAQQNTSQITQIFKDDSGTRRVLLGKGKGGFYGVKVSEENVDVYDAADDELVFNSNQKTLKIVDTNIVDMVYDGSAITVTTYNHNLGFAPSIIAFLNDVNVSSVGAHENLALPTWLDVNIDTVNDVVKFGLYLSTSVTTTDAHFILLNATGATGSLPIKFYLLQESAT